MPHLHKIFATVVKHFTENHTSFFFVSFLSLSVLFTVTRGIYVISTKYTVTLCHELFKKNTTPLI